MTDDITPATAPVERTGGCPRGCPGGECYCEPAGGGIRFCGHGDGLQGCCTVCHGCIDCDACYCGED